MTTVTFLIEKVPNGIIAYAQGYSLFVDGDTIEETRRKAITEFEDQCRFLKEDPADYTVTFRFDLPTFFAAHAWH
ncbi:hypothetical protein GCM10027175_19590 [Hymenobacter latericoloratus]